MTAPEFEELNEVRNYNPGIDNEYCDQFYFYFYLELNDVDTSEPVTAKLQYADIGSDNWVDCPMLGESVLTAEFDGDDTFWSCEDLVFDIMDLTYKDAIGLMKQARIVVDFTYLDGNTGSVSSTDLDELFIYTGGYIHAISSDYEDDTVTCTFRIDTDLVLDLSKLEMVQLTLTSYRPEVYYHMLDIMNDAEVTPFASDGTFTVTYTATEPLDPDDYNEMIVAFDYVDHNDFIEWRSSGFQYIDVPFSFTAPALDSAGVEQSEEGYSYIPFTVTVGDGTMFGDLTAYLQHWNGSGYETFSEGSGEATVNTISLEQNDDTSVWTVGPSSTGCLIADLDEDDGFDFFRVAIRYIDDAGAEQFLYSDPMVVYKGTFIYPDEEMSMFVGDGFFYAYYWIDTDVVDISKVSTVEFTAISPDGTDILIDTEWFTVDEENGEVSVRGEVDCYGPVEIEYFIATVKLVYTDADVGPVRVDWTCESSIEISLDSGEWDYAPEVISAIVYPDVSENPTFYVTFELLMNDAESVTAKLYCCDSIEGGSFSECDPSFGTIELTHDNLTDPVDYWIVSLEDLCLSYTITMQEDLPGAFCWFYIEFECTLSDGSLCYVYSDDLPAFCGSFFDNYSDAIYNPVNQELFCSWAIYQSLAPSLANVSVVSVRIVPYADGASAIDLPTDCVTFYAGDGSDPHIALIIASDLALSYTSDCALELTLSYSTDQYTWTRSRSVTLATATKYRTHKDLNSITPLMGPAGGTYHEEKEQGQNLCRYRYCCDPRTAACKSEVAAYFGKAEKCRERDRAEPSAAAGRLACNYRSVHYCPACDRHSLAELSDPEAYSYGSWKTWRQVADRDKSYMRAAEICCGYRRDSMGLKHTGR
ncbi:MAG: hypothetical protein J5772_04140 [Clostridia bacterium]|nr:hypothetical protein [Clostridia bacterium]